MIRHLKVRGVLGRLDGGDGGGGCQRRRGGGGGDRSGCEV